MRPALSQWQANGISTRSAARAPLFGVSQRSEQTGSFSAPCKIFEPAMGTAISQNVTGTMNVSAACDVTGSVSIPGDPQLTLRYGHINGNGGSGIATQAANANLRTLHFTLVKQ
jgi:hypothetical protein